jgi:outer membrane protein OmpA-like peptidoglycan-associated protein
MAQRPIAAVADEAQMTRSMADKTMRTASPRTGAQVWWWLACVGALVAGCVSGAEVEQKTAELAEQVRSAREPAYYCAPRDLALAEANLEHARYESERGDPISASEHLQRAAEHTAKVVAVKGQKGCCADNDGDLICNADDKCPEDAEDVDKDQDEDGCPEFDRDGDGLHDQNDRCPDQPEDKDGFLDEDGCPDDDNDADGVPDKKDKCVNVAEDRDGFDDLDGCPDFDNDGDGINDAPARLDNCPNEPEVYNGLEDIDGCPDKLPDPPPPPPPPPEFKNIVVEQDRIVFKKQIQFATGSAKIVGQVSEDILNECAQALKDRIDVQVQVEGHTDERGSDSKNKKLSQSRAESVVNALVTRGIARSRLIPIGFGEERPLDPAKNAAAYEKNRRVEFNFLPPEK